MRKRDMHILSAGMSMYTSDLRFQVIHPEKSENWTLQIRSPQERDSGVYECQVSTEPKMSLNYSLNIVGECSLNYSVDYVSREACVYCVSLYEIFRFDNPISNGNRFLLRNRQEWRIIANHRGLDAIFLIGEHYSSWFVNLRVISYSWHFIEECLLANLRE